MAYVKDVENGIGTVGELIESLKRFPMDMRVGSGFDETIKVCRLEAEKDEIDYPSSTIEIEGDDGEDF